MARGPLPRLPALAAAPRLHPSPRGRRGGRARSLADSSGGSAGLRAAALPPQPNLGGGLGGATEAPSDYLLGRADLVVIVPEEFDQPLAVARVDRQLARQEASVGTRANREGGELDQLRRRPGHHLDAQNLLGRAVEDELEVAPVLTGRPPVRRARDVMPGDVTLDPAAHGLGVREPDARDLGRREDRLRDDRVLHGFDVAAERVERRGLPLVGGGGCELHVARRVARGVDVGQRRPEVRVDLEPQRAVLQPDRIGPGASRRVAASDRQADLLRGDGERRAVARGVSGDRAPRAREPLEGRAEVKRHPAALQRFPDVRRDIAVERRENLGIAGDHGDGGAEVAERSRHLEADHAAADEHEALRKLRQEQEIVGGDREPAPRNRRHDRLGARGDDDLVALDLPTVGLDRVRVDEARLAEVDLRPRLLEGRSGRLELADDRVLAPDDRVPVERDVRTRPRAEGPRLLDQPVNPPRPYQGLFGNSPTVDAGTSERPRLHERYAGAELHALLQGVDAARAATDYEEAVAIAPRLPRPRVARLVVTHRSVRATWAAPRSAARGSSTSQTGIDAINSANRPLSQNAATNAPSASFALSFGAIPPPR